MAYAKTRGLYRRSRGYYPSNMQAIGKLVTMLGTVLLVLGLVLWLSGGRLGWLGRLPGDLRIGESVYIPITTCVVLSIALTLLVNVITRIFWR